jgi:hypothetical protein
MQRASTLSPMYPAGTLGSVGNLVGSLCAAVTRVFGCHHSSMSRPFTCDDRTYRVCLKCGMRRDFDLETWTMSGPFYIGT